MLGFFSLSHGPGEDAAWSSLPRKRLRLLKKARQFSKPILSVRGSHSLETDKIGTRRVFPLETRVWKIRSSAGGAIG